jgi:hypothetical protein
MLWDFIRINKNSHVNDVREDNENRSRDRPREHDSSQHHEDRTQAVNKQNSEGLGLNQSVPVVENKDSRKTSRKERNMKETCKERERSKQ